ncbi:uncharacterized protein LOC143888508 [Tasmannia lanceolata]|uniref:uncharacterized protein LOC143888508 n=1 Tax=Tasmannia lanceolata TaxID=3420 RepID=UPI0040646297
MNCVQGYLYCGYPIYTEVINLQSGVIQFFNEVINFRLRLSILRLSNLYRGYTIYTEVINLQSGVIQFFNEVINFRLRLSILRLSNLYRGYPIYTEVINLQTGVIQFFNEDLSTGKTIGTGREVDGLYRLDCKTSTALHSSVDTFQWHCRLGHPSLQRLQKTHLVLVPFSPFQCESCELGKHHRVSFPSRVISRVSSSFELVHSDVWGPSRVASSTGFKYFIIFIDDFFRMTWVYLLKNRSEVFFAFRTFLSKVKNQYNCNVKCLRTDNAGEYFSSTHGLQDYLSHHGILHQSSCAYTSQQNGVAECKLCYLLEVVRTLLFQMSVPKLYWSGAILTGCFLANRLPSSVLDGASSFSILTPDSAIPLPLPVLSDFASFPPASNSSLVLDTTPTVPTGAPVPPKTTKQYQRRKQNDGTVPLPPGPSSSQSMIPSLGVISNSPIASRTRSHSTAHPISNFVSYDKLTHDFKSVVSSLSSTSLPKSIGKALEHPGWRDAMNLEMGALHSNEAWDLVPLPSRARPVGCRWVFSIKYLPDGTVERLKAWSLKDTLKPLG